MRIVSMQLGGRNRKFECWADIKAAQRGAKLKYEDIGDELMALRKEAFEKYDPQALWNVAGHATFNGMLGVAEQLRCEGDLKAAFLAARIDREVARKRGNAA